MSKLTDSMYTPDKVRYVIYYAIKKSHTFFDDGSVRGNISEISRVIGYSKQNVRDKLDSKIKELEEEKTAKIKADKRAKKKIVCQHSVEVLASPVYEIPVGAPFITPQYTYLETNPYSYVNADTQGKT